MSEITLDSAFYQQVRSILNSARNNLYQSANSAMLMAYWCIGKCIVEQQEVSNRADYGTAMIEKLSQLLIAEFGKGFTTTNLRYMRQFYLTFPDSNEFCKTNLTWTHFRLLLKVEKTDVRRFYLEECDKGNWSTRQLERQINSFYYERLLSSQNTDAVRHEITRLEPVRSPKDFIRDPYVLEFAGIKPSTNFYEKDLEQALINELQQFLLELGRGFSFVARQKHIDLDGEHFYIDLVFYNYILKCFVLIDLKTGKLTHQDIGQMDTYIRLYDQMQRGADDNPTIGIILCSDKNKAIAKYSILNDSQQLFASKYQLTLPTAEELENYIEEMRSSIEEHGDLIP